MGQLLHRAGLQPLENYSTFFHHVLRDQNSEADALAREAVASRASNVLVLDSAWTAVWDLPDVVLEGGFDGGAAPNPGPAGCGIWLRACRGPESWLLLRGRVWLGEASNNEAEFSGVYILLRFLVSKLGLARA